MLLKYYQKIKVFAGTHLKSLFICGILLFLLLPIYDKYLWIENDPFDFGHIVALEKYNNIAHIPEYKPYLFYFLHLLSMPLPCGVRCDAGRRIPLGNTAGNVDIYVGLAAGICLSLFYAYFAIYPEKFCSDGKRKAEKVFILVVRNIPSGNIVEFGIYPVLLFRRGLGRVQLWRNICLVAPTAAFRLYPHNIFRDNYSIVSI
jgi:hypothetical protein